MEMIQNFFHSFWIFHINGFYSILYFLKNNFLFIFVLFAIGYLLWQELNIKNNDLVDDERRII